MTSGVKITIAQKEKIVYLWLNTDLSRLDIHKKENVGYRQIREILKETVLSKKIRAEKRERWSKRISLTLRGTKMPWVAESNRRRTGEKHPSKSRQMIEWHRTHEHPMTGRTGEKNPMSRPEVFKKWVQAMQLQPNKPELYLLGLLQRINPDWRYTGDGALRVEGKVPDFWDGNNGLCEHYGDFWHKGDDPQDRISLFEKSGFSTLVIWEHELKNPDEVLVRIKSFSELS